MAKRYTNGVTDISGGNPMGNIAVMDPRKYSVYHEDFNHFSVGVGAGTSSGWAAGYSLSPSADATISIVTDAGATGPCLKQAIVNQATSYSRVQVGTGGIILASGKKAFMETKFELTAATLSSHFFAIGMCTEVVAGDATAINDKTNWLADDSWMWFKELANGDLYLRSGENDVNVDQSIRAVPVTATWYKLSCYFDGTVMYHYVDNVLVAVNTPATIPVTPCAPIMMVQTKKAEACVMLVDYLTIITEL
jgi:hypothetical protein